MFSSLVNMRTSSDTCLTEVASTLMTRSTGAGHFRFRPLVITRLNWPKRSTTPIWRASITVHESSASQPTTSASTIKAMPPEPPPIPLPPPLPPWNKRLKPSRRRLSNASTSGGLPCQGSRLPLPGSFQAMVVSNSRSRGIVGSRIRSGKLRAQPLALAFGQAEKRFEQRARRVDFDFPAVVAMAFVRHQALREQARAQASGVDRELQPTVHTLALQGARDRVAQQIQADCVRGRNPDARNS